MGMATIVKKVIRKNLLIAQCPFRVFISRRVFNFANRGSNRIRGILIQFMHEAVMQHKDYLTHTSKPAQRRSHIQQEVSSRNF